MSTFEKSLTRVIIKMAAAQPDAEMHWHTAWKIYGTRIVLLYAQDLCVDLDKAFLDMNKVLILLVQNSDALERSLHIWLEDLMDKQVEDMLKNFIHENSGSELEEDINIRTCA